MRFGLKISLSVAALALLGLSACAPTMTHHGYLAIDAKPADIKVGDSQATVLDKLGAPSQTSIYDPQEWYYIDQVSMKMTYKEPHVTARSAPSYGAATVPGPTPRRPSSSTSAAERAPHRGVAPAIRN